MTPATQVRNRLLRAGVIKVTEAWRFACYLCSIILKSNQKINKTMFNFFKSAPGHYENLDGQTFKTKFQGTAKAELLDVRTAGEFASGTIPGARNLDITTGKLPAALNTLDKDKEYFVFCRSGNRSGSACQLMTQQGFKVYNLAAGIGTWPNK
jgi:rhodanese-related sulfurtransferase